MSASVLACIVVRITERIKVDTNTTTDMGGSEEGPERVVAMQWK